MLKLNFMKKITTRVQKTTFIQLLCNYPQKYGELINSHVKKLVNYIIVASELKMGILYDNLYALYIHLQSTMFDILKSWIISACDNYFRTIINVPLTQQLCYN